MRLRIILGLACFACRPQELQVVVTPIADRSAGDDDTNGGDVAHDDLPGGDVAHDDLPGGDVARDDLPGDDVASDDLPGGDGWGDSGSSKKANGRACTDPDECTSAFCADGVCCNDACGGGCQTCIGSTPGSCELRAADDDVECSACKRCDGTSMTCQAATCQLLPIGSVWRYLDNGSDQGTAWTAPAFNDSGWLSGPGQLGYGDGDEATVVSFGPDSANKYVTTYFRTVVTVAYPSDYGSLLLRVIRDDGIILYVNGVEVLRDSMPAGAVTSATWAAVVWADPDEKYVYEFSVPNSLVAGSNTLAAEVHQANATSTDVSFDLEVVGEP